VWRGERLAAHRHLPNQEVNAEDIMKLAFKRAVPVALVAATLAVGACASQGDVDALRSDVAQLRDEVRATRAESVKAQEMSLQASNNAAAAAAEARNAAAAANAAAERAERMFQKTLRK
jgi:hypothetical protein